MLVKVYCQCLSYATNMHIFADNGFPLSIAAQLRHELPNCRLRIATCKSCVHIILRDESGFNARLICDLGPGLQEGIRAQNFDEVIAFQSAELDLSG